MSAAAESRMILGECLAQMESLKAGAFDCILTDLPYGTTNNKWDQVIPMAALWEAWKRLLRPGGPVILTTQQPFTTVVAASNLKELRTEWIWEKEAGTGFLNANKYPLKNHENVLVFCDRRPPYFPQKTLGGKPYKCRRNANSSTNYSNTTISETVNLDGSRFPVTVLRHRRDRGAHPTQKPVALLEYLIRTYTQPGEMILDCCAGSGSTLVAAVASGRRCVGIELDPSYFATAQRRLDQAIADHGCGLALSAAEEAPEDTIYLMEIPPGTMGISGI